MKLNLTVDEQKLKVSPRKLQSKPSTSLRMTQVTGWSYYLWVLDVYPVLAEGVNTQMMKEEEE